METPDNIPDQESLEAAYAETCRSIRALAQTLARNPGTAALFKPLGHLERIERDLSEVAKAVQTRLQNLEKKAMEQAEISVD